MNNTTQVLENKSRKIKTIDLVMTGMLAALICVISPFSIPTQIPFTLAVFAVLLTGAILPPRYAFSAVIVYIFIGLCGVPVYSGFRSGPEQLFGVTGGYLMSFPIMAFITAIFYKYIKKYKTLALVGGMLISLIICYILGTLWFSFQTHNSIYASLSLCVIPYIPVDLIKIALAASLGLTIRKTVMKNLNI